MTISPQDEDVIAVIRDAVSQLDALADRLEAHAKEKEDANESQGEPNG